MLFVLSPAKALDYIKNYPGITYEEVGSNG